jgi:hypothetical protein
MGELRRVVWAFAVAGIEEFRRSSEKGGAA